MDGKHTCDTIFTHFQGITNNIYGFGRRFFASSVFYLSTHISTRPYSFLPVQMALHKARAHMCTCTLVRVCVHALSGVCNCAHSKTTDTLYLNLNDFID